MDEPLSSVKIIDVSQITPVPTRPDSASPKSLPLTFFDILWLRFPPVERLFFYQIQTTKSHFYNTIVPKLKHSLSLSLQHYLPLTGNLIWPQNSPKPLINYLHGDGVSFTTAESHKQDFLSLTSHGIFPEAAESHPLIPQLYSSHEKTQVIALQVTLFPCSGFTIGISSHHACLDGKTSTSFVKSWALICKSLGELTDESTITPTIPLDHLPFYDRAVVADPTGLGDIYAEAWLKEGSETENRSVKIWNLPLPPNLVRGTFELSREKIEKLRKLVTERFQTSSFSLTCSYTSVCLCKAIGLAKEDNKTTKNIRIMVDLRTRLKPAIPATYFGNCVIGKILTVEIESLVAEDGIVRAAEEFGRAVESLKSDNFLKGIEGHVSTIIEKRVDSETENFDRKKWMVFISFAGSPRFEVYSADFGFGKPKRVEMSSIDRTGAISLSDSKNGNGGVEIGLVLKRNEMEAFASEFDKGLRKL